MKMKNYTILLIMLGLSCYTSSLTSQGTTPSKPITFEDYDTSILPDRNTCGIVKETPKIYGGKIAQLGEFPWIVALEYKPLTTNEVHQTLCAGSLINERYVLTAANCVNTSIRIPTNAILGEWKRHSDPDCVETKVKECADPILKIKIQDIIQHEEYNRKTGENDIALIRLDKDVGFTEFVSPICLPPKNLPLPQMGELVTVAGWGKTETERLSDVLLKVALPITSSEDCGEKLHRVIGENRFCAGGEEGKDSCQGDSGSFAISQYGDETNKARWYQFGIVSSGAKCGIAGYSGIYTNVEKYMDWIVTSIRKHSAI